MFPNTKIDWASDLFRGDIIHPKGLSPCVPFHASLRFLASSPSIEDRTGRADGGEGESWPVLCVRNVAPRSPSPPVNTTLLSRNHSLRETKSQFIWKTRLTHLSSALITERRVGWCLAEGPPADSRPVARGAGRGRSRGGPVPLPPLPHRSTCRPRTVRAALPRNSGSVCCTPLTLRPLTRRRNESLCDLALVGSRGDWICGCVRRLLPERECAVSPAGPGAGIYLLLLPTFPFSGGDFPQGCPRG